MLVTPTFKMIDDDFSKWKAKNMELLDDLFLIFKRHFAFAAHNLQSVRTQFDLAMYHSILWIDPDIEY